MIFAVTSITKISELVHLPRVVFEAVGGIDIGARLPVPHIEVSKFIQNTRVFEHSLKFSILSNIPYTSSIQVRLNGKRQALLLRTEKDLPGIVWRLARENDLCTFGQIQR